MDRITYVRADLGQSDDIYRAMLKYRPDQVVHLVSLLAGPCEANPPQAFRVNSNSTLTLLEAGAIIGLKRLVMTSSILVFGRGCWSRFRTTRSRIAVSPPSRAPI